MCQYIKTVNIKTVVMREKGISRALFGVVMCRYKDCGNERESDPIGVVWSGDVSIYKNCQYKDCGNERERDHIGVVWSGDVSI